MPPRRNQPKEDPYDSAKAQIDKKLALLSDKFEQWRYILEKKNTANTDQFQDLSRDLRLGIKEITQEVSQINKVNTVVENHRERFPAISDSHLFERKAFVNDVRFKIASIEKEMDSERAKNKIKADESRVHNPVVLKPGQSGDQYVSHRHQQYQAMDDESDAVLQDMSAALERLHAGSRTVNVKLHEHKEIISEMDDNITNTQNLLGVSLQKVNAVLNKSTKAKWIILGLEILILAVLLILIIYT